MYTTKAQICIRRDTAANFTSANPTLALGEIAYETDTQRFKVGTGSTVWTSLGYAAQNPTSLTVAGNITCSGTGAITMPSGTIAQRPGTPAAGMIRHNSTSSRLEYYNGTAWQTFQPETLEVEYLVVAGGGSGGGTSFWGGGGGGAGGYRTNVSGTALALASGTSYTVLVGAGGAFSVVAQGNGSNSQFASITSTGGGCGQLNSVVLAANGGSGGGGAGQTNGGGALGNTPATVPSQGNDGGDGFRESSGLTRRAGGGGGGASAAGSDGVVDVKGGDGGAGESNSITGSAVNYAGGGGGGYGFGSGATAYPGGAGGVGGGGVGCGDGVIAASGTVNTGGGGGGAAIGTVGGGTGGNGGSGIVIVRYLGPQRATGGTVTAGTGSAAGYTIHEFKTSGTFALVA